MHEVGDSCRDRYCSSENIAIFKLQFLMHKCQNQNKKMAVAKIIKMINAGSVVGRAGSMREGARLLVGAKQRPWSDKSSVFMFGLSRGRRVLQQPVRHISNPDM